MDKNLIKKAQAVGLMKPNKILLPDWKKQAVTLCKNEYPTIAELVVGNNMDAMCTRYKDVDRKSLIAKNTFVLSDLKHMYSNDAPEMLIQACLMYLNRVMNLKDESKLNDAQIRILGRQLYNLLQGITIGELWLFFDQLIGGVFGKFYGNIDPMDLNNWARDYMNERGKIIISDDELMIKIRDRNWKHDDKLRSIENGKD